MKLTGIRRDREREDGQIIVLFALSMVVILAMGGLLFTGAQALVLRRQLQNAGDAGALAAANLLIYNHGCLTSPPVDDSGGIPLQTSPIVSAAADAVVLNIPGYARSDVKVSCPGGYQNDAVRVDLAGTAPAYFGVANLNPKTSSVAVNGQIVTTKYSVALLDPSNPRWTSGGSRSGCASYTINGGPAITYEGSVIVNSSCTLATSSNGAVKAANNSFTMTMLNGAILRIVGQASSGTAARITPTPIENFPTPAGDPLSGLAPPCHATGATGCLGTITTLPARNTATNGSGQCASPNSDPCVLQPGTYSGGILAGNGSGSPSTLLLRPGVYYIEGGGLQLKSGAGRILAIPADCGTLACSDAAARARYATALTDANLALAWQADCPPPPAISTCGVMIYNAPADPGTSWRTNGAQADQIAIGGQGVALLRAYNPANDPTNGGTFESYKNLVVWQARTPPPTKTAAQPVVQMSGNGCVVLSGSLYASGAEVQFGGSTCGSGGGGDAVTTLQFVAWDLTLAGSNTFYFAYQGSAFAIPTSYGLIQ